MWTSLLVALALGGDPPPDPAVERTVPDTRTAPDTETRVQRGPEVGEAKHDASPPLRDLPPAPRRTEKRVHPVKPLPRPQPPPDPAGDPKDPK